MSKSKNKAWLERVRASFKEKFFAKATAASKNSRRKRIVEILGRGPPFEVEDFEILGAVLDAAEMKAGEQYLQEAKGMHVEDGWSWDLRLESHLTSCKRALKRDRGPEKRALEVKIHDLKTQEVHRLNKDTVGPARPGWVYAWAVIWMMRSIEVADIRTEHVTADQEKRTIKLLIPKSKMDQKGSGVQRTLKCCGKRTCEVSCPWEWWMKAKQEASWEKGGRLFPSYDKKDYSKLQMVSAWVKYLRRDMSGHSARRSGAMMYARAGMSLPEISFLGRWRSSAVLRYVEEALTEIPVNQNVNGEGPPEKKRKRRAGDKSPTGEPTTTDCIDLEAKEDTVPQVINLEREELKAKTETKDLDGKALQSHKTKVMWVVSTYRGRKTSHEVGQAGWGLPLEDWTTICGWHFARKNVKVQITTHQAAAKFTMCQKCKKGRDMRDGVNRAREWAHTIGDAVEVKGL